jgi:ribose transport system permease protein
LYRGIARYLTDDQSLGFGNSYEGLRQLAIGKLHVTGTFALPFSVFILVAVAVLAHVFLERTIWGRYLLALGRNETATRFSGINTDRMKILAYVICSLLAGVGGILFSLNLNSIQPSGLGEFYELYAIAAAVLGGCSLRGGEGTIIGVIIGTAVMRVLYNAINILGIPTHLEFAIIGAVILAGVVADEVVKRVAAGRAAARQLEAK